MRKRTQVALLDKPIPLLAVDGGLDFVLIAGLPTKPRVSPAVSLMARKGVKLEKPTDFISKKIGVLGTMIAREAGFSFDAARGLRGRVIF